MSWIDEAKADIRRSLGPGTEPPGDIDQMDEAGSRVLLRHAPHMLAMLEMAREHLEKCRFDACTYGDALVLLRDLERGPGE